MVLGSNLDAVVVGAFVKQLVSFILDSSGPAQTVTVSGAGFLLGFIVVEPRVEVSALEISDSGQSIDCELLVNWSILDST